MRAGCHLMDESWEHVTDSESLLEWERIHRFNQESPEHESICESPLHNASAKAQPSNPRAPFVSIPTSDVHFSLGDLHPGLPAPSFDNKAIPRSLPRIPTGNPSPIPSFAESTPESLRYGSSSASGLADCGKSSEVAVVSPVAKRVKGHQSQSSKLPVLGH